MAEVAACLGYAAYEVQANKQISVSGKIPMWAPGSMQEKRLQDAWAKYGDMISRAVSGSGFPVSWFMGILCAESLGNPNACSPCDENCSALYPNCQPCCAYGIMQITDSTSRAFGGGGGQALMGNPELSFTVATRLFVSIMKNVGLDLVKIAASYNSGKFRCKAGATNLFGNVENQGYAERVVTFANTSVRLGLGSEVNSSEVTLNNLVGVGLLAVAGYLLYKMYLVK